MKNRVAIRGGFRGIQENTFFNANSTLTARYSLFDNTTGVDVTGPGNLTTASRVPKQHSPVTYASS